MSRAILAPDVLEHIRQRVVERTGIEILDELLDELRRAVDARARALGEDPAGYAARLALLPGHGSHGSEIELLATELPLHETFFYRGREQLDLIVDRALDRIAVARPGRPIRVLSAGASSGAEAYSIAILVRERRPDLVPLVQITGDDLSPRVIAAARRGRYHPWALRQTPPETIARWFCRRGDMYEVDPRVRAMATFEVRNLLASDDAFWAPGAFDVILCRHVLIYLAPEPAQALFSRLERSLSEEGYLFLAPDDMLRRLVATRELHCDDGAAHFHGRRGASPAPPPPPAPRLLPERDPSARARSRPRRAAAPPPSEPDAVQSYLEAVCQERTGDLEGALRHATVAAYLDPTFAMPCMHLALVSQRRGDRRAARREFTRALSLLALEEEARIELFGDGLVRADLMRICQEGLSAVKGER